jgi:hypothetical protein
MAAAEPEHRAIPRSAINIVGIELTVSSASNIPTRAQISIM